MKTKHDVYEYPSMGNLDIKLESLHEGPQGRSGFQGEEGDFPATGAAASIDVEGRDDGNKQEEINADQLESNRKREEEDSPLSILQQSVKIEVNPDGFDMFEPVVQLTVKQETYS